MSSPHKKIGRPRSQSAQAGLLHISKGAKLSTSSHILPEDKEFNTPISIPSTFDSKSPTTPRKFTPIEQDIPNVNPELNVTSGLKNKLISENTLNAILLSIPTNGRGLIREDSVYTITSATSLGTSNNNHSTTSSILPSQISRSHSLNGSIFSDSSIYSTDVETNNLLLNDERIIKDTIENTVSSNEQITEQELLQNDFILPQSDIENYTSNSEYSENDGDKEIIGLGAVNNLDYNMASRINANNEISKKRLQPKSFLSPIESLNSQLLSPYENANKINMSMEMSPIENIISDHIEDLDISKEPTDEYVFDESIISSFKQNNSIEYNGDKNETGDEEDMNKNSNNYYTHFDDELSKTNVKDTDQSSLYDHIVLKTKKEKSEHKRNHPILDLTSNSSDEESLLVSNEINTKLDALDLSDSDDEPLSVTAAKVESANSKRRSVSSRRESVVTHDRGASIHSLNVFDNSFSRKSSIVSSMTSTTDGISTGMEDGLHINVALGRTSVDKNNALSAYMLEIPNSRFSSTFPSPLIESTDSNQLIVEKYIPSEMNSPRDESYISKSNRSSIGQRKVHSVSFAQNYVNIDEKEKVYDNGSVRNSMSVGNHEGSLSKSSSSTSLDLAARKFESGDFNKDLYDLSSFDSSNILRETRAQQVGRALGMIKKKSVTKNPSDGQIEIKPTQNGSFDSTNSRSFDKSGSESSEKPIQATRKSSLKNAVTIVLTNSPQIDVDTVEYEQVQDLKKEEQTSTENILSDNQNLNANGSYTDSGPRFPKRISQRLNEQKSRSSSYDDASNNYVSNESDNELTVSSANGRLSLASKFMKSIIGKDTNDSSKYNGSSDEHNHSNDINGSSTSLDSKQTGTIKSQRSYDERDWMEYNAQSISSNRDATSLNLQRLAWGDIDNDIPTYDGKRTSKYDSPGSDTSASRTGFIGYLSNGRNKRSDTLSSNDLDVTNSNNLPLKSSNQANTKQTTGRLNNMRAFSSSMHDSMTRAFTLTRKSTLNEDVKINDNQDKTSKNLLGVISGIRLSRSTNSISSIAAGKATITTCANSNKNRQTYYDSKAVDEDFDDFLQTNLQISTNIDNNGSSDMINSPLTPLIANVQSKSNQSKLRDNISNRDSTTTESEEAFDSNRQSTGRRFGSTGIVPGRFSASSKKDIKEVPLSTDIEDHSCAICLELLYKPVTLVGCGHTFCESCVLQHEEANAYWGIAYYGSGYHAECPLCRHAYMSNERGFNTALATFLQEQFPKVYNKREKAVQSSSNIKKALFDTRRGSISRLFKFGSSGNEQETKTIKENSTKQFPDNRSLFSSFNFSLSLGSTSGKLLGRNSTNTNNSNNASNNNNNNNNNSNNNSNANGNTEGRPSQTLDPSLRYLQNTSSASLDSLDRS